jgi:hypothetical protein
VVVPIVLDTGLRTALGSPLACLLLVSGMAVNAAALVLDEVLVGLLKGRLLLLRNAYFAASCRPGPWPRSTRRGWC